MSTNNNEVQRISQPSFNFFDTAQFETMQRVCTMFANSELVPEMYKVSDKNPMPKAIANCMVAIELASRIGASPLMIMQNMVPIYGKPSWSSKFLIATVNSCGRFEAMKYRFTDLGEIKNVEYVDYEWQNGKKAPVIKKFAGPIKNIQCIAYSKERGSKEELESIPVTIEMAIKEGWYTKNGSKWKTMERLMLTYRAASFWTSAYAPELSMGIKTTEEVIDIQDISHEEVLENEVKTKANKESFDFDDKKPTEGKNPEDTKTEPSKKEVKEEPKKAASNAQAEPLFA
jgi:hypothetical protein